MHASLITLDHSNIRQPLMRKHPMTRATTKDPSRILAMRLEPLAPSKKTWAAISESFLRFSPRVFVREIETPAKSAWVFIDIASTSHLFLGEEELARTAAVLAKDLGFGVKLAVADTPSGAQAFAMATSHDARSALDFKILPPGEEREWLRTLSLPHLLQLEGVTAWAKPSQVESIITFFMMLGFKTAADLGRFNVNSFKERWGDIGVLFFKRVNAMDRQVISPMLPTQPLEDYVHLDFPNSLVSLLLHQAEKSLDYLFARLHGRKLYARKLVLTLHCEYSKAQHKIEIEPNTPSRNRDLFVTLMEKRLGDLDLLNPIRDFEMHVIPCPEKESQLDFFEPRVSDSDKLQTLFSLLLQSGVKPGLYEIEPAIMPERGWKIVSEPRTSSLTKPSQKAQQIELPVGVTLHNETSAHWTQSFPQENKEHAQNYLSVASTPAYGANVTKAPRPSRILPTPLPLTLEELQGLKILSYNPIERLEDAWWEEARGPTGLGMKRDYYFAVSGDGQCLWIYQDLESEEYFLHGYFD
jgi:protein ImuB